jgi:hypothetical protein
MQTSHAAVDLYWIPLGAGNRCVRFNGRVFEAIHAARRHRPRCELYHAALVVECDDEDYTIEVAPSPDAEEASRGVVATGAVGSRHLRWLRLFRYEVRCWRGGCIPDLGDAVGGPRRLTGSAPAARRVIDLVASVPTPVWGRDELNAGEMWNSNSVAAWLIATAGLPTAQLRPPPGGRAPGWDAGLEIARPRVRRRADTPQSRSADRDPRLQARAAAGRAVDTKLPVEGLDAVGEAVQARARDGVGAADPVIGHLDEDATLVAAHAHGDV